MTKTDKIVQLLDGRYEDPDGYGRQTVETRSLVIEPSLSGMELDLVKALGFGHRIAVVSDVTTHAVLGKRVEQALGGAYTIDSIVLGAAPHPDDLTVAKVRKASTLADALVAVGSGTINDLSKFASSQDKKPYAVFATAPSMNGYTSVNAAITEHNHKKSLPAQAPLGAFFDLAILSSAPARLIRAGLGDSLCRSTSQADWLLAHHLLDQEYRELPYDLLADDETELFEHASDLLAGSHEVMEKLVRTLVLSGFGTAIIGNSKPASQGEHLISHFIDMLGDEQRMLIYHGEQIGVTTLSMARLQRAVLDVRPVLKPDTVTRDMFASYYGEELGASCWQEFSSKLLSPEGADVLNEKLEKSWDSICTSIEAISLQVLRLEQVLADAGAPVDPEEIDLTRSFYSEAILHCREIRNRYTFLDLAANSGLLTSLIDKL